ncbi:MAG: hypothetical protein M2R45_04700 [Verrucomicrobia subdivision 3 bacterium]|nr:hypothetical protein [Limisphaerales bacterium]MCS1416277.1 hypothetical protein [Limisphaerales bacterium]
MFRIRVSETDFPWLKRCRPLILKNTHLLPDQVRGYEIAFDYT